MAVLAAMATIARADPGPVLDRPAELREFLASSAAVLAGADAWTGGGGPAVEGSGGVELRPVPPLTAWFAGRVELLDDGGARAFDTWNTGLAGVRPRGIAPDVELAGSAAGGWGEGAGGIELREAAGRAGGSVGVAVGGRLGGGGAGLARVELAAEGGLGPLGARLRGRCTGYGAGPPAVVEVGGWLTGGGDVAGELGFGAILVPRSPADPVPGLPAPGASVWRWTAAGSARLADRERLRVELTPELGTGADRYVRVRAMVGVAADLGPRERTAVLGDERVRFAVRAPDAEHVEVVGSFTGWEPRALAPARGGWWEVVLAVPSGRWEYVYRVDGEVVAPPEAAWVDDGLGGANGLVEVP